MMNKQDVLYRQIITLSDGSRVLLRPLIPEDRQNLIDLYANLNADELRMLRHDVSNPEVVSAWIDDLDYDRVLPILALVGEQLVGNATLHFHHGPARHRAEVRIFLSKEVRRRGLGTRMLQALIDLAKRHNLYLLEAEILADQTNVIKAFKKLGFEQQCNLDDYFMLPDGEFRDVAHLILQLRETGGEF
jgi:RimJ/RimL family protein N-acetyltransferase